MKNDFKKGFLTGGLLGVLSISAGFFVIYSLFNWFHNNKIILRCTLTEGSTANINFFEKPADIKNIENNFIVSINTITKQGFFKFDSSEKKGYFYNVNVTIGLIELKYLTAYATLKPGSTLTDWTINRKGEMFLRHINRYPSYFNVEDDYLYSKGICTGPEDKENFVF